jgi:hypothetical protein
MEAALKKKEEGLYEQVYPADRLAISQAGGMYYWWNDGLPFWAAAVVLTASGVLIPLAQSRRTHAA